MCPRCWSGGLDPITPPSWAAFAARTIPNATQLVFPNAGHAVGYWSASCFATTMASLLASYLYDLYGR